jgi:hypothetical protein
MSPVRLSPFPFPLSCLSRARVNESESQQKQRKNGLANEAQNAQTSRVPRRAPRRLQDPEALRRQERDQGFLEVPQRERAGEVRRQIQDWHRQGGPEAVKEMRIFFAFDECIFCPGF